MSRKKLVYNDTATLVVAESEGYRGSRVMVEQHSVNCIFLHDLNVALNNNQETIDTDAVVYLDISNEFIIDNYYRLEGMYIMISPFGSSSSISWYRITSIAVNRSHLLDNVIDNIECLLKKSEPVPGVS